MMGDMRMMMFVAQSKGFMDEPRRHQQCHRLFAADQVKKGLHQFFCINHYCRLEYGPKTAVEWLKVGGEYRR